MSAMARSVLVCALLAACGTEPTPVAAPCVSGVAYPCTCASGQLGGAVCVAGTLGACVCGGPGTVAVSDSAVAGSVDTRVPASDPGAPLVGPDLVDVPPPTPDVPAVPFDASATPPEGCNKLPLFQGRPYLTCCCGGFDALSPKCAAWGGQVVSIDDAAEAAFLAQYVSTPGNAFIAPASPLTTWCPGQPSQAGPTGGCPASPAGEDCVSLTSKACRDDWPCNCPSVTFCEPK